MMTLNQPLYAVVDEHGNIMGDWNWRLNERV